MFSIQPSQIGHLLSSSSRSFFLPFALVGICNFVRTSYPSVSLDRPAVRQHAVSLRIPIETQHSYSLQSLLSTRFCCGPRLHELLSPNCRISKLHISRLSIEISRIRIFIPLYCIIQFPLYCNLQFSLLVVCRFADATLFPFMSCDAEMLRHFATTPTVPVWNRSD